MTLGPLMLDIAGTELTPDDRELLRNPVVGGLILFARNFATREQVSELVKEMHSLRDTGNGSTPLLIAVDQEGGRVQRFKEGFTELPPLRWIGRQCDVSHGQARHLAMLAARIMATEILDTGVDFSFAPCVDLDWQKCEVIGDRALHGDPETVAELGLAYMQGMRQVGMAAVAKHFPGHGAVTGDSHLVLPEDVRSYEALTDDMHPYESLIADGLQGVMMAHIRYAEVDQQIASLSQYWMGSVLREQLGFNGAIFSDDLSMKGASVGGDAAQRAVLAMQAGSDMVLLCNDRDSVEPVIAALEDFHAPAAHARLAAMRADQASYRSAPYGSEQYQNDLDELLQALNAPPPPLELDGG